MNPFVFDNPVFEWDDAKSEANRAKHGIDFIAAVRIFLGPVVVIPSGYVTEERYLAVGRLEGRFLTVVFTLRSDVVRVISARRSRDNERRTYCAHVPENPA